MTQDDEATVQPAVGTPVDQRVVPLVEKLRGACAGYDEWRVQSPKDGSYCMAYSWPETMNPEREAREWLADHVRRFPGGLHSDFVVAKVRVQTQTDALMQEAADELERLQAEVEELDALRDRLAEIDAALGLPEDGCNSTQRTLDAVNKLKADAAKSERRAIMFGDIVHTQALAMRAAYVDAKLNGSDAGMTWIENTLEGPGQLPNLAAAKKEGGAQCMFNREMAEHEAFRAAHPAP